MFTRTLLAGIALVVISASFPVQANAQVYEYKGPNQRAGGVAGTFIQRFEFIGNGEWEEKHYTVWDDGTSEPEERTVYTEKGRQRGGVELAHAKLVPLRLEDTGIYMYRTWPGDGYPFAPPNEMKWWKLKGQGRWAAKRP